MDRTDIIRAIESEAAASGLKPTTICQYAIKNRHFYGNLVSGLDYRVGTAHRIMIWIEAARARRAALPTNEVAA
jgi:hypothetical protein